MAQSGQEALDWSKYEGEILDLFVSQNKTLNEVMSHMNEKHNFKATVRQYKFRFPNLKNVKAEEWIWIDREMQRRAVLGKESEPLLYDRPLPLDRVVRGIARHGNNAYAAIASIQVPNPSPGRVSVRTPPPLMATAASGPSLFNKPIGNRVESCAPQASVEASSTQQSTLEVTIAQEQILELDAAMEVESEIEANLFRLDLSNGWNFGGNTDFDWATANRLPPATIMRRTPSFDASDSPRSQLGEHRLSPFSQFINLEVFDTRPSFQLMTNLPWFRLQSILEQPEYITLQIHPLLDGVLSSPTSTSMNLLAEMRRSVLSSLLGLKSEVQLAENIAQVTRKLQKFVPERYEGEVFDMVGKILDARSTGPSSLFLLFGLAASFASNNNLEASRTDTFLRWVIDQKHIDYLEPFLQIDTPTIHAFATKILKSAVRIKNIKFLTALLDHGVRSNSILEDLSLIDDIDFTKLVLSKVEPTCFKGTAGAKLFHQFIKGNHFDLARMLIQNGVSVDYLLNDETSLYSAVSRRNVIAVKFLLDLGANVNHVIYGRQTDTALGRAVFLKDSEIAVLLMEHGAKSSCTVDGKDLLEWSSLNCRKIYSILKKKLGSIATGVTVGDLVNAANQSSRSLRAYIDGHQGQISKNQLEKALRESIQLEHIAATVALLRYGVDPDGHTLDTRPLLAALDTAIKQTRRVCELLIRFGADFNVHGALKKVIRENDFRLLQTFVMSGVNIEEQGMEALVESVNMGEITSAAYLLDSGVDIDTPGLELNPLQMAAYTANLEMVDFLLTRGADVNAPAHPDGGRTALQAALGSEDPVAVAGLLLDKGADIFAPPALVGGVTTLEAACHCWGFSDNEFTPLCNRLLDADAPVNRPNGEPSSALHGINTRSSDKILARILEPQRNAIINYMWCDEEEEEDEYHTWEPRTPTQLAAERGQLNIVRMLLDRGADINEGPAYRFGRTALQAATSSESPDMELIQFLLEQGADVNAKPAVHGGITALQGAAISGNVILAKLLIDKGADVNAAPSFVEGRYAIEGAAEHGRLDMVQLLLNAGAMGNVFRGTGFEFAIELAEENDHAVIENLLKNPATLFTP